MPDMNTDVRYVRGIGEQRAKYLKKLHIETLGDLINYFPRAYEDRTAIKPIQDAQIDETVCIMGMVSYPPRLSFIRKGMELVKLTAVDETGSVDITYFNQTYIKDQLKAGETYVFYGKIGGVPTRKSMANPLFEPENSQGKTTGCIVPVYKLTAGVSQKIVMNAVQQGLEACGDKVPDYMPDYIREHFGLAQARFAYNNIHFPENYGMLELARRRLVFEELFILACSMGRIREAREKQFCPKLQRFETDEFVSTLPFSPTNAQRKAIDQAISDMCSGRPMSRLIQGDVGSGKTMVAVACMWFAWKNGLQSAFMAPTEILAQQHYATFTQLLKPFGVNIVCLTGSMSAKEKRGAKARLLSGESSIAIGTHALISKDVEFKNLGLVITDEQHRFGVQQRAALVEKGISPHVMVMSATPIPRTLALIIYGDLDVSIINELPPDRQKVDTFAVNESYRQRLNNFICKLVTEGRQVYIVCPKIDDGEDASCNLKSALEHSRELESIFPQLKVGCIHGKMKPKEKDAIMSAFISGDIDILVSTTVIEVGVDVPNAALIIIENAERFGLSQLHQLRGRVGRGQHKSYCVLVSDETNEDTKSRLKIMCHTNDGFKISEEDLKLRGPGDFFGSRQHGLPEMHIADLYADLDILNEAQEAAKEVLRNDPKLEKSENVSISNGVNLLLEKNIQTIN